VFSKEESARIRQEFWTSFGKSFPRKWLLYNTKIKDLSLKFYADRKKARVMIDIEMKDELFREAYYDKFLSLKSLMQNEIPELIFEKEFYLENGKQISRIYTELTNVSIHNKNTWHKIYAFFNTNMEKLENFFIEYQDFIKDI
jgi:hypothetical protein